MCIGHAPSSVVAAAFGMRAFSMGIVRGGLLSCCVVGCADMHRWRCYRSARTLDRVFIAALWRHRAVQAWAALAGALLGVACALGCAAVQHTESRNLEDAPSRVRFEALADGSRSMYGSSVLARTELPSGVHAIVLVRISEDDIVRYGEVFEADASLAVPSGSSAAYCWRQGAVATARASDISLVERHDLLGTLVGLRNRVIDALADLDAGDGSAVLAALVCGWRIPLEEGEVTKLSKSQGSRTWLRYPERTCPLFRPLSQAPCAL